jgi:hypothetical protein
MTSAISPVAGFPAPLAETAGTPADLKALSPGVLATKTLSTAAVLMDVSYRQAKR